MQQALGAVLSEARAAGLYDEGVADLRASSVTLKNPPEEVAKDPATGAVTKLAQVDAALFAYTELNDEPLDYFADFGVSLGCARAARRVTSPWKW